MGFKYEYELCDCFFFCVRSMSMVLYFENTYIRDDFVNFSGACTEQ